jgi:hypothetical protein
LISKAEQSSRQSVLIRVNPWANIFHIQSLPNPIPNQRELRSFSSINKLAVNFHRQSLCKSTASVKIRVNPWANIFFFTPVNRLLTPLS